MYCVYCGVRLQDGAAECPLCHTKVQAPAVRQAEEPPYSGKYPQLERKSGKYLMFGLMTIIFAAAALSCIIFCLKSRGEVGWSGIAALGIALGWICLVLPRLFSRWKPMIFLPVDFVCLGGYLLYICVNTGGHWFLSFAFPVTMITGILTVAGVAMMRYIVQGRLRLMSLLVIAIGLSFMLIEFFQHITFQTPMFVWSLYGMTAFCMIGLFLFIASFIPSMRAALRKKFFF